MIISNISSPLPPTSFLSVFGYDNNIQYLTLLCLLFFSIPLLLSFVFKHPKPTAHPRLPPSPPAHPIIGHLLLLSSKSFFQSFQQISSKFGPLLYLRFGSYKCVIVSSSELATEMFKNHDLALSGKPRSPFKDKLLFGNAGFITAQHGGHWKFMKKLTVTELLGPKQILRSRHIRREERIRFLQKMMVFAARNEGVKLEGELFMVTNNSLRKMALGEIGTGGDDGIAEMCRDMVLGYLEMAEKINVGKVLGPFKMLVFWMHKNQLKNLTNRFDGFMDRVLEEHEEKRKKEAGMEKENKDVVDILLEVYHDEKAEAKISLPQIKAFILDLFVAGSSSQADTTQWALAELINHPNIFKKAREEIESVVVIGDGGSSRLVEEADLPQLNYLQAIVKETLRLHPPLPVIPRLSLDSFKIGEYDVPNQTPVLINAEAMMRDPTLWDNPLEFFPGRFLDENGNISDFSQGKGLNFNYLPFGVGRRMCPGNVLGQLQVSAILATMIQCFDWEVAGGGAGTVVSMEVGTGTTARMAHPLQCIPKLHFNPFAA